MRRIIVLNIKGGCGKTTVATNLAACYAARGFATTLMDYDPQASAMAWLRARPHDAPKITGVATYDSSRPPLAGAWQMKVPRETQRVVVDTQGGMRASDLVGRITPQDSLLIPIQASAMDIRASADFIRDLMLTARLRCDNGRVGIIANRTRQNSQSLEMLQRFLDSLKIPVIATLPDSGAYLDAADQGLGVYELPVEKKQKEHWLTWRAISRWLEPEEDHTPVGASVTGSAPRAIVESSAPVQAPRDHGLRLAPKTANEASKDAAPAEPRIPSFLAKGLSSDSRH